MTTSPSGLASVPRAALGGRAPGREGRLLLLLLAALLLGAAVPAFFLVSVDGRVSAHVLLCVGIIEWATFRMMAAAAAGQRRLTLLCFYVFVYTFFGVVPMMSAWTGQFPHQPYLNDWQLTRTILHVVIGLVAFEGAYLLAKRPRRVEPPLAVAALEPPPVLLSLLWLGFAASTAVVLLAIGYYGPNIFLGIRGGIAFSAATGPVMSQTEGLLVVSGLRGVLAAQLFVTLYLWTRRHDYAWLPRDQQQLRWLLVAQGFVNAIVSNPLSSARLWSGSLILTVLFMAVRWRGARSYLVYATGACLALLGLFSAIDPRRIIAPLLLAGEEISASSILKVVALSLQTLQVDGNFDAFQMLGLISQYADERGVALGRQVLLPLLFWVPRSVWPSKPIGTPDVVADSLGFFSLNVGAPLWAEGYINFGVVGIVLMLGLFGVGARLSDDFLVRTVRRPGPMFETVASAFYAANTIILLRGDLTTGTMYMQMVLGFTLAVGFVSKRAMRRARAGAVSPAPAT